MLFEDAPAERAREWASGLAYANWQRATVLAAVTAPVAVVFGLLPDLVLWQRGWAQISPAFLFIAGLHATLAVGSAVALVLFRRFRPAGESTARAVHQRGAMLYAAAVLVAMTLHGLCELRLTGTNSGYMLGLAAVGLAFYLPWRLGAAFFGGSLALLAVGLGWDGSLAPLVGLHAVTALCATVVFWFGARCAYALKVERFLQQALLEDQARQLTEANAELTQAHRFKTELLGLAAHDLRDPLHTIALSAQTLRDELPKSDPGLPLVAGILDSARRMETLVANLLTDAESATREITLVRVPTDLPRLVLEVADAYRPMAAAKRVALHFSADESALRAPPASVDPTRFRQIVENLVGNAVKYSPVARNVWASVSHSPDAGYRVVVRDEGQGLTAEDKARLFGKFQQLSARPTAGEVSTGLGLAIVKRLVDLHGGRVWAESEGRGHGTQFIVTIP